MKMLDVKTLELENQPMARPPAQERDAIDEKIEVWLREIPDLDVRTEGIVDRIGMHPEVHPAHARRDARAVRAHLGRGARCSARCATGGAPYRSTPGRLGSQLGLSSGAMTARLDKMEEAELIRRLPDPDDRRGVVIELTDRGRDSGSSRSRSRPRRSRSSRRR